MRFMLTIIAFALNLSSLSSVAKITDPVNIPVAQITDPANKPGAIMTLSTFIEIQNLLKSYLEQANSQSVSDGGRSSERHRSDPDNSSLKTDAPQIQYQYEVNGEAENDNIQKVTVRSQSVYFVLEFIPYKTETKDEQWGVVDLKIFASAKDESASLEAGHLLKTLAQKAGFFDEFMRVIDFNLHSTPSKTLTLTLTRPTYESEVPLLAQALRLATEFGKLQRAKSTRAYFDSSRVSCLRLLK